MVTGYKEVAISRNATSVCGSSKGQRVTSRIFEWLARLQAFAIAANLVKPSPPLSLSLSLSLITFPGRSSWLITRRAAASIIFFRLDWLLNRWHKLLRSGSWLAVRLWFMILPSLPWKDCSIRNIKWTRTKRALIGWIDPLSFFAVFSSPLLMILIKFSFFLWGKKERDMNYIDFGIGYLFNFLINCSNGIKYDN